jgi:hypothetical protein
MAHCSARPRPDEDDQLIEVPPGATLVLDTDGLVERRGETIDAGIARLVEPSDDIAIVALRLHSSAWDATAVVFGRVSSRPSPVCALTVPMSTALTTPRHPHEAAKDLRPSTDPFYAGPLQPAGLAAFYRTCVGRLSGR